MQFKNYFLGLAMFFSACSNIEKNEIKEKDVEKDNSDSISALYRPIQETYVARVADTTEIVRLDSVAYVVVGSHKAVDLGLPSGTLWAYADLGADSPFEKGEFFYWGETKGYKEEPIRTYAYVSEWEILSHDEMVEKGVVVDSVLTPKYDAATQNMGENWCMPTRAQVEELVEKCEWSLLDNAHQRFSGYKATGPNGNSIFFIFAGSEDYLCSSYYWSEDVTHVDVLQLIDDSNYSDSDGDQNMYNPVGTYESEFYSLCKVRAVVKNKQ